MEKITPKQGDRIVIEGMPPDYEYRDLYRGLGVIDNSWNGTAISDEGIVGFFQGYVPYKDKSFEVSGCGRTVKAEKLSYIETKPGTFWKFKNGIRMAHNSEYYEEPVNYFRVNFNDLH